MSNGRLIRKNFTVINEKGLHMRPSTELAKCAQKFNSEVRLIFGTESVDATSVFAILMLAARTHSVITIEASGPDAESAVAAIIELAKNGFNIKY